MVEKCTVGSRAMVMNGTCEKTSGGLKKTQLKYNPNGKIRINVCKIALNCFSNSMIFILYIILLGKFFSLSLKRLLGNLYKEKLLFIFKMETLREHHIKLLLILKVKLRKIVLNKTKKTLLFTLNY